MIGDTVSELAMQCEDLMALLRFIRLRANFTQEMLSYDAGRLIGAWKGKLAKGSDAELRRLYMVPSDDRIAEGTNGEDAATAIATVHQGIAQMSQATREAIQWYDDHASFHNQYKHGLKIALKPFNSELPQTTIDERKQSVAAPVFAYTNGVLNDRALKSGVISFPHPGPKALVDLNKLAASRQLLRIEMLHNIDLDHLITHSWEILALEWALIENRFALLAGLDEHGMQRFRLPLPENQAVHIVLQLQVPVRLDEFPEKM